MGYSPWNVLLYKLSRQLGYFKRVGQQDLFEPLTDEELDIVAWLYNMEEEAFKVTYYDAPWGRRYLLDLFKDITSILTVIDHDLKERWAKTHEDAIMAHRRHVVDLINKWSPLVSR